MVLGGSPASLGLPIGYTAEPGGGLDVTLQASVAGSETSSISCLRAAINAAVRASSLPCSGSPITSSASSE